MDVETPFGHALRTQAKTADVISLTCPFCAHEGRVFQSEQQLWDHARRDHAPDLHALGNSPTARAQLKDAALRRSKALADTSSDAVAGTMSTPDITNLSLDSVKGRHSPQSGRKRPAEADHHGRRGKVVGPTEIVDPDQPHDMPYMTVEHARSKPQDPRLFDYRHGPRGPASPLGKSTPNMSSEDWSVEANKSQLETNKSHYYVTPLSHPSSPLGQGQAASSQRGSSVQQPPRQAGLLEAQKYDNRYPDLLLQPDSRPISQEQLASEVKSIYAGLTMVETKCIHVDRAQALTMQESSDSKLANDHWQALIALHRTLLHEHHDFFLASQHPSASPALRRLASKYSMPARMWKHGIHSFLELLRRKLPDSLDYMLAFIYLAYQMMALLYETVPAFEDTWIECLGDLGRYRMAIEDEDIRDRETWAGVARSWYSKAADKNPSVGRLYHHLAILARPNALQQLYYYARSLNCVKPFESARESSRNLFDPILIPFLNRQPSAYSQTLPIDTSFILAHSILFEETLKQTLPEKELQKRQTIPPEAFEDARLAFQCQLDNHIGRVTAKWKEQGVYLAIANLSAVFEYGLSNGVLRLVLELHAKDVNRINTRSRSSTPPVDDVSGSSSPVDAGSPSITEPEVPAKLEALASNSNFTRARLLTFSTLSQVLRRIGDKNVLPHVHVLLSFLYNFGSIKYVAFLVDNAPWSEIALFLNTIVKSEQLQSTVTVPLFVPNEEDSKPLPEDYLIRGQLWSQLYFPEDWFAGEHDEEERSLELASTVKSRTERILRLGYQLSSFNRWISYDHQSHTFSAIMSEDSS